MPRLTMDRRRQRTPSSKNRLPAIVGIGVDCEQVSRFENMDSVFLGKVFTKKEREYCRSRPNPSQHFAARFAGKEAVMKCLGSARVPFDRIEIVKNGKAPAVSILDKKFKAYDFKISLSHSGNMAIAFAVAFRSKRVRKR